MKTCFFIGHHDVGEDVLPLLEKAVAYHITEYHVTGFCVGCYGAFDRIAARAVKEAKLHHPEITLTQLLPYHPYGHPNPVPNGFDDTYYPPGMESVPKKFAIIRANKHMIDNSTHIIAYAWHSLGNAGDLVKYARKREEKGLIHVENLAKQIRTDAI